MKFCPKCGHLVDDAASFCSNCGKPLFSQTHSTSDNQVKKRTMIHKLSDFMGNDDIVIMNWKILFKDIFKKHSSSEAEDVFMVGTSLTTPLPSQVTSDWHRPWLYSRVFAIFAAVMAMLLVCVLVFDNVFSIPGLIFVGAFAFPLAVMILFLELNAWRDISFYKVALFFLTGGGASLLFTLLLFDITGSTGNLNYIGAMIVGFVEELGKAVIVYGILRFVYRYRKPTILGGMLIGACVGAGFAAFESAGYAFVVLLEDGFGDMFGNILLRGLLAPGGHVAWAAITGGAIAFASNGERPKLKSLISKAFLRIFILSVILHALWDCPLLSGIPIIKYAGLVVLVWIVVMILIDMGLDQLPAGSQPLYKK